MHSACISLIKRSTGLFLTLRLPTRCHNVNQEKKKFSQTNFTFMEWRRKVFNEISRISEREKVPLGAIEIKAHLQLVL